MILIFLMKKLAALVYAVMKLRFVHPKRVLLLSRQFDRLSLDYRLLISDLRKRDPSIEIVAVLCRFQNTNKRLPDVIRFFWAQLRSMHFLATSAVCVLDSYWPAVSVLKHRDSLTVIQKWHAAGKIKQSGYQTIGKPYGRGTKVAGALDMHRGYDVIIAGGKKLNPFYCASFNVTEDKLFNVGLPRQDWLLRHREGGRQQVLRQFPQYAGKQIVLYAPTFRVNDRLDCSRLVAAFDREDFALIVRPHQRHLLAEGLELDTCPGVTTVEILCACDWLITDYSAISFEAAAVGIKTVFYLYDYEQYKTNNGLNIDVARELPECSYFTAEDVAGAIMADRYDEAAFNRFREQYLPKRLGHSTESISKLILDCVEKGKYEGIHTNLERAAEAPVSVG